MPNKIFRNRPQTVGIAQDTLHLRYGSFAGLNLIRIGTFLLACSIVFLNFAKLSIIEYHTRSASFINDPACNTVRNGFRHRVRIHDIAENAYCLVNRRSREADISRIRERIVQIFCKTVTAPHAVRLTSHLLCEIGLRTVSFIRNANNVCPIGKQLRVFGEFVNRRQKNSAARAAGKEFPQFRAAFHRDNAFVSDKLLCVPELLGKLRIQIRAVRDQNNGRARKLAGTHQHPRQEKHCVAFPATCRPEISSALPVAAGSHFGMRKDICKKLMRRKKLRIAANDFQFFFRRIGQKNKILYHAEQTLLAKQPAYHRLQRIDPVRRRLTRLRFVPRVEKIIRGEKRAVFVIHSVTDDGKRVALEKLRNIPPIAHRQLPESIINRRVFPHGTLKLKHDHRQAVDKNGPVGNASFRPFNFKLVDDFE